MKTENGFLRAGFLLMILLGMVLNVCPVFAQGKSVLPSDRDVKKAFNLRMDGKVDQAKKLLEDVLSKDSTNAMAYYELSRLQYYMLTRGGNVKPEDMIKSVDKAVSLDPKNIIFAYYRAITCFINAFMSEQQGSGNGKALIGETIKAFDRVLELNPKYTEAMLYLVDIYGMLPKEMGGDSLKALAYAEKLEKTDKYFGAKARADLLPENSNPVQYWENLLSANKKDPKYLSEVGIAYLYKDDPAKAEEYFNQAKQLDPSYNILILDLARYHIYKTMQNKDLMTKELPLARTKINEYLKSVPEPIIPLKAYSIGFLVLIEKLLGNQEQSDKLMSDAKALDPYFSRASGIPNLMLFDPPDKISHHYFSFFKPY